MYRILMRCCVLLCLGSIIASQTFSKNAVFGQDALGREWFGVSFDVASSVTVVAEAAMTPGSEAFIAERRPDLALLRKEGLVRIVIDEMKTFQKAQSLKKGDLCILVSICTQIKGGANAVASRPGQRKVQHFVLTQGEVVQHFVKNGTGDKKDRIIPREMTSQDQAVTLVFVESAATAVNKSEVEVETRANIELVFVVVKDRIPDVAKKLVRVRHIKDGRWTLDEKAKGD